MRGWRTFSTQDLIKAGILEIGDGYRAKNSEMADVGVPFIRAGDVNGRVNTVGTDLLSSESAQKAGRKRSMPGDVVITTKGTIGRLAFVCEGDPGFIYSPQLCYWRSLNPSIVSPRWLLFAMKSKEMLEQISWSAGQTDMAPYVSLTDQRTAFKLTLPPIEEQRRVAEILGALDDKIESNRRIAATLEEMARALYRSWFVDFDPVRARAEGRDPAHMDPATAALFPDSFGADGLPIGWVMGTLDSLAVLNPEKHSKRHHPDYLEYVDLANTKWGNIEATSTYDWSTAPSRARMCLRNGDTIIGTVRPGNGSYAFVARDGLTGSTGFAVLRAKENSNAALVYLAATDSRIIEDLINLADGGAYPAVRPDVVAARTTVIATKKIQACFAEIVTKFTNRIKTTQKESSTLATLRDILLPRLMSGELRVYEVSELTEEIT
jgi:type I restriction enzyme S subunit